MDGIAFICGCGHSGTSLLANMLAAHPDVYIPLEETSLFLKDRRQSTTKFQALLKEARRAGKRFLVEKTPNHINRLGEIRELVPGARFIVPVRDGRDVAASIAKRVGGDPAPGIERWIQANTIVQSQRDMADVHIYRHEDLIEDPTTVLQKICQFTSIPFNEAMLNYHLQPRCWFGQEQIRRGTGADGEEHRALRNWQINQPIFDNRGRWRSELQEQDVAELTVGRGRSLMQFFHYL